MCSSHARYWLFWCCFALLLVETTTAAELTILNPSFETTDYGPGGYSYVTVEPGWTKTGNVTTIWQPGVPSSYLAIPDGQQVFAIDAPNQGITQVLSHVLEPGAYDLTVAIGNRLNRPYSGYNIQLLAGSTTIASETNAFIPVDGTFQDTTISYVAERDDPLLGETLSIRLFSGTASGSNEFDFVRLNLEPDALAPEPASIALFGVMLVGGALFWWRKRRR